MNAQELFTYLTDGAGLSEEDAKAAMRLAQNPNVGNRAAQLKQQREYDELNSRFSNLESEFSKAKTIKDWYDKYGTVIQQNENLLAKYMEKYGTLEAPRSAPANNNGNGEFFSKAQVEAMISDLNKRFDGTHDRLGTLLVQFGNVTEEHRLNGFKTKIDFEKLAELSKNHGGDVMKAYREFIKPDMEKKAEEDFKARVEQEVADRLKKERSKAGFPAGAEGSVSTTDLGITRRKFDDKTKDDPAARRAALIRTAATGKYNADEEDAA